jgi:rhodanese-related sulfurtransferase
MKSMLILALGALLLGSALLVGCARAERPAATFVTEYGLGPDKWAAAWLLTRQVEPGARLLLVAPDETLSSGIPFDLPQSRYRRKGELSTYEVIRHDFALKDPIVEELGRAIQDIEVYFWMEPATAAAPPIEHAFRGLQQRHGREAVPAACYLAFFDKVYAALTEQQRHGGRSLSHEDLEIDCQQVRAEGPGGLVRIPELPIAQLLEEMARGKKVVFIDVREPDEFAESHIPGALNIPLRDAGSSDLRQLKSADYVVSYCVKDFRGFEMARTLRELGVRNSVILHPYGIRGWVSSGLPVAGGNGLSEAEAARRLEECLSGEAACLSGSVLAEKKE